MTRTRSIDELLGTPPAPATSGTVQNGPRFLAGLYALAIFLGAFLLFQVQPLIGKCILPWFGGTPGVWMACLLFFQVLLFCGYAYAHWATSRIGPKVQTLIHLGLLLAACAVLPIAPNAAWKPTGNEEPVSRILILLAVTVGLPFFVLSTTGPLLQSWFSRTFPGRSPYRLYALSNGGSLLALLTFPVVFEWAFPTQVLTSVWSWTFVAFAVICGFCAWRAGRRGNQTAETIGSAAPPESGPSAATGTRVLWFALAMVPSVLLLATTNQVCLDVASVPFLWIAPLMLYLLTFILCFDSDRWYSRRWVMPAAIVGLGSVYYVIGAGSNISLFKQVAVYFASFFLCAFVCHGELARRKPPARDLTLFYLLIAGGGAAGGMFVALIAPLLFSDYLELHLGLLACAGLMVVVLFSDSRSLFYRGGPALAGLLLIAGWGALAYGLLSEAAEQRARVIDSARNFFGVLRVTKADSLYGGAVEPILALWSGRIAHGFQYQRNELRDLPTAYYNRQSGVGRILSQPTDGRPRRVGLVGLGVGTLAAYAHPGDTFHFYEINPAVERLARAHFDFLSRCAGKVEVTLGDARLALERDQQSQNFDVLVLDAFSGDAIPVHLLTAEAFAIYERHLAPDGVIAVHISNRHFSLRPVVEAAAERYHFFTAAVDTPPNFSGRDGTRWVSSWILLSRSKKPLEVNEIRQWTLPPDDRRVVWTDDHVSLADVYWLKMLEREQREAAAASGRSSP